MERRILFASLGALVVPALIRPALAQSGAEPLPGQVSHDAETNYMKQTLMYGSLSLVASRRAQPKVMGKRVVEFVKFEIAEQETVGDILMGMMKPPSAASGQVIPPTDAQAMANIDSDGMQKLMQLDGLTGSAFETAFIQAQVDTHHKLLDVQNSYLGAGKNREALDVAKLAKGMITEHLQLLADIQSMPMRRRSASTAG